MPKIIHTPPPNILEGNGVLYRNFTLNSLVLQVMTCYFWGGPKNNSYTPPNILEGYGVLYGNFTLNSLVLQVMTCYFLIHSHGLCNTSGKFGICRWKFDKISFRDHHPPFSTSEWPTCYVEFFI